MARRKGKANTTAEDSGQRAPMISGPVTPEQVELVKERAKRLSGAFARESEQMFRQEYDPACAECGKPLTLCGGHGGSYPKPHVPTTRPPGWLAPMPGGPPPPIFVTLTDEDVDRIARRLWHLIRGVEPPP